MSRYGDSEHPLHSFRSRIGVVACAAVDGAILPEASTAIGRIVPAPTGPVQADDPNTAVETSRKAYPIATGVLDYFPDAIREIAHVSYVGNEQHNPGMPVHWDRTKSTDEADAMIRHYVERGTIDTDGLRHTAKMAWRALALLQKEIETHGR